MNEDNVTNPELRQTLAAGVTCDGLYFVVISHAFL
jgi:hypothetical protein